MTDLRDAARQALEALEFMADEWGFTQKANRPERWQAIEALKAALEQQGPAMKIPPPSNTDRPHYGQRDTLVQGNYFMRHMLAMTGESLHAKSAIAAELAHHHGGGQREQILVADAHDGAADVGDDRRAGQCHDQLRDKPEVAVEVPEVAARRARDRQRVDQRLRRPGVEDVRAVVARDPGAALGVGVDLRLVEAGHRVVPLLVVGSRPVSRAA